MGKIGLLRRIATNINSQQDWSESPERALKGGFQKSLAVYWYRVKGPQAYTLNTVPCEQG